MTPEEEKKEELKKKKEEFKENIEAKELVDAEISGEMRQAYINYAMSVIVSRALPSAEDGLKPVHRRILWAMHEMGLASNKPTKKSARIVGDVLGKFHPHGDLALYEALVRMAQPFSLRYPLIKGQGNFGSMDGDPAAAMRYCVTGDSLIVTEKGLEEINKISKKEDINLKILSKDKKIHNASKWFDSGEHETIKITTNKGYTLTGSKNHPLLILTTDETGKPIFTWKLLEQIKEGDLTVIDRREDEFWPTAEIILKKHYPKITNKKQRLRILPEKLNADLAFILGALISEGSILHNKLEFCNSDVEIIKKFKVSWDNIFPDSKLHIFKKKPSSYGKKEYYRLECHCRYTLEFLRNIGLMPVRSDKKSVPSLILKSPKKIIVSYLRSYFEGDGSISSSKKMIELSCCSKSPEMIRQLQVLFLRFGIDSFRRYDKYKQIWKLYLRGKRNILRFYKNINFECERKKKKLEIVLLNYKKEYSLTDYVPFISDFIRNQTNNEFVNKHNFDRYGNMEKNYQKVCQIIKNKEGLDYLSTFEYLLTYNYLFEPVTKTENVGILKVYSLKVESNCHTFISNGFISHNTEAKMEKISEELIEDIEKKTVPMLKNFDNTLENPVIMPGKVPNLLLNGSSGIAVGMATNMPPHNLNDVCDTIVQYIDNPQVSIEQLIQTIKAPDFPTGGYISGNIKDIYTNGRGKLILRGRTKIEEGGKPKIVITEIPYQVNKSTLVEDIANLAKDKKLPDVSDIRDESAKGKVRIVIELRKGADAKFTQNRLYKYTKLQNRFDAIMLALVGGQPKLLNLKEIVVCYVDHRRRIIRRRTEFDLNKAEDRLHIVLGLLIAQKNIDEIIKLIKKSKTTGEASQGLQEKYKLSQKQAQAILETKLQQLTSLEVEKLNKEEITLKEIIAKLKTILGDEKEILKIIKRELNDLKKNFGDLRRTSIIGEIKQFEEKDLVIKKEVVVTLTEKGYAKRMDLKSYREQKRGGRGVIGSDLSTGDFVRQLIVCSTHDYLLFFTDKGRVFWLKAYQIPATERYGKGKALINILNIKEERIQSILPVKEYKDYIFMTTAKGIVKKMKLELLSNPRSSGVNVMNLPTEGDIVIGVKPVKDKQEVLLVTKKGQAIRFNSDEVRPMGRASYGVTGIKLDNDAVVSLECLPVEKDGTTILTITEKGYGKRSAIDDYRITGRAGKGVINLKVNEKVGDVVSTVSVKEVDSTIITTAKGIVIRSPVIQIRVMGRATQGVRLVKIQDQDKVTDLVKVEDAD